MKKRLTILTCLMLVCTFMFGQTPDWGTNYQGEYNDVSMNYAISIKIDGEAQNHTDLEIAPFSEGKRYGDPVRLTQAPAFLGGNFIAMGSVKAPAGASIKFKMYDYRTHEMFSEL